MRPLIFILLLWFGTSSLWAQKDSLRVMDSVSLAKDSLRAAAATEPETKPFSDIPDGTKKRRRQMLRLLPRDTVKHWSITGKNTLSLNQASFNNWASGGANNIGWITGLNYNFTYEDEQNLWENIIVLGYGQSKTQGLSIRKTQDIINFSTNYGRKFSQSWYLSAGAGIITQFSAGYDYDNQNPTKSDVYHSEGKRISLFMAPGYVNVGVGLTYKPSPNFSFNIYPGNARMTLVLDPSLQYAGNYGLLEDGQNILFQLGMLTKIFYKLSIMENIHFTNNFTTFSNYLENPERMVINYLGTLDLKVNKLISASVVANIIYDHNQIRRTQLRQTLGIGLTYNITNGVKRSEHKHNREWKFWK